MSRYKLNPIEVEGNYARVGLLDKNRSCSGLGCSRFRRS